MARGAFTDPLVIERMGQFVPLKINGKRKGYGEAMAAHYKIPGYPTFIILNESGDEVDRKVGFLQAKDLLDWTAAVQKGEGTFAAVESAYKKNPADNAAAAAYAAKLNEKGDGAALSIYEKLAAADPENKSGILEDALAAMADAARMKKDNATAETHLLRLMQVARKPDSFDAAYGRMASLRFRAAKKLTDKKDAAEKARLVAEGLGYIKTLTEKLPPDHAGYADSLNDYAYYLMEYANDHSTATPIAERAVAAQRDPAYLDTLAELRFHAGRFQEAVELEREAQKLAPEDESIRDTLAKFEKGLKESQEKKPAKAGKATAKKKG